MVCKRTGKYACGENEGHQQWVKVCVSTDICKVVCERIFEYTHENG